MSQQLNNKYLRGVLCEAYTDVSDLGVGKSLHLALHFEQQTVSVHVLCHLSIVTASRVVIEVRVTHDGLLLDHELVMLANLGECVLIRVVPCALSQQVVGEFERSLIRQRVNVDLGATEASSEVVDSLDDLTAHLAHLVKGRQVGKLGILVEVQRLVILALARLNQTRKKVSLSISNKCNGLEHSAT